MHRNCRDVPRLGYVARRRTLGNRIGRRPVGYGERWSLERRIPHLKAEQLELEKKEFKILELEEAQEIQAEPVSVTQDRAELSTKEKR